MFCTMFGALLVLVGVAVLAVFAVQLLGVTLTGGGGVASLVGLVRVARRLLKRRP